MKFGDVMKTLVLKAAALFCFASSLQAATLVQQESVSLTNFLFASAIDDTQPQFGRNIPEFLSRERAISVGAFDTSLGTLTSVAIRTDLAMRNVIRLDGDRDSLFSIVSDGDGLFTQRVTARFGRALGLSGITNAVGLFSNDRTWRPACTTGSSIEPSCPLRIDEINNVSDSMTISAATWNSRIGTAAPRFELNLQVTSQLNDGDELFGSTSIFSGSVRVDYRYTPHQTAVTQQPSAVPLPAGMPLILAGLGTFAWLRRKAA